MSNQDLILPILPRSPHQVVTTRDRMPVDKLAKKQQLDAHKGKQTDEQSKRSKHSTPQDPEPGPKDHQIDEFV